MQLRSLLSDRFLCARKTGGDVEMLLLPSSPILFAMENMESLKEVYKTSEPLACRADRIWSIMLIYFPIHSYLTT